MQKLNVLLVTGVVTTEHDWRATNQRLVTLLESTGRFTVRITEDFRGSTAATLENYDAVFLNYDGKSAPTDAAYARFGYETEKALFDFVACGKGLVVYHSSAWLSDELPEAYKKLWGMYFTTPAGGRRNPRDEFVMQLCDKPNPITRGLPRECYIVNDDLFAGISRHPEAKVEVLATACDSLENYRVPNFPPPHHPVVIPEGKLEKMPGVDKNVPVAWTNSYGKGRVFGVTLGHEMETLGRVPFLTLLCRGTEWAASGEVTLDEPDRRGENRLKKWPYYV